MDYMNWYGTWAHNLKGQVVFLKEASYSYLHAKMLLFSGGKKSY
jgi:hypothetical protein